MDSTEIWTWKKIKQAVAKKSEKGGCTKYLFSNFQLHFIQGVPYEKAMLNKMLRVLSEKGLQVLSSEFAL